MKTRENTLDDFVVKEQKNYLKQITLNKEDIWLDAGANIGAFADMIAKDVRFVYGFEPEKDNFELAIENNKESKNVFIYEKALVANQDLVRKFYLNKKMNKGAHSFLVKGGREEIEVQCININDVIKQFNVNKIKMDVEGAEYELIKKMDFNNIEEIIVEYHFNALKDKQKEKYREIIEILKNNFSNVVYKEDPKKAWQIIIKCNK